MDIFFLLVTTALPLLVLIALGFFAGRKLHLDTMTLANLAIFIIAPVVNFGAMTKLQFDATYLLLPLILYVFASAISLLYFRIATHALKDTRANIVGMSAGSGNTGYFGIPIVLALFGSDVLGIYLLMNLAIALCEVTVSYYIGARSQSSMQESLRKVVRLPHLYAVAAGLTLNYNGIEMPTAFYTYWDKFVGAWIIIGMMIMGATLSKIPRFTVNLPLLTMMLIAKFVLWPLGVLGLILLDQHILHLFDAKVHTMMMILSLVPLAVNTVAFAIKLDLRAGDAAIAVLISTLIAIFYLPVILLLAGLVG
jgi:predicted permease